MASILEVIRGKRRIARLILDEEVVDDDFVFVIACNTIHTGKAMKIAPNAKFDDGKIDLIIVRNTSRTELLKLFPKPSISFLSVESIKFSFNNHILYIFVFFDGLSVASSSLFGFFFPKLFSDIFGANFGGNDLVWLKFVLLPGVAINVLLMFFALTKNRPGILLSNILRVFTTVSYLFMWGEATIIRSLLNLIIIHHVIVVTTTFVLYFKKEDNTTSEELNSI